MFRRDKVLQRVYGENFHGCENELITQKKQRIQNYLQIYTVRIIINRMFVISTMNIHTFCPTRVYASIKITNIRTRI